MANKIITIAEYMNTIEAEMAQQLLADYGVKAILKGTHGGDGRIGFFETIKLQVFERDALQAKEVLEEQEENSKVYGPEGFESEEDDSDESELSPTSQSSGDEEKEEEEGENEFDQRDDEQEEER